MLSKAVRNCGSFKEHEGNLITLAQWRDIVGVKTTRCTLIMNLYNLNICYI